MKELALQFSLCKRIISHITPQTLQKERRHLGLNICRVLCPQPRQKHCGHRAIYSVLTTGHECLPQCPRTGSLQNPHSPVDPRDAWSLEDPFSTSKSLSVNGAIFCDCRLQHSVVKTCQNTTI